MSQVDFRTRRFSAPQARVQEFTGDVLQHVEPSRALRVLDIGCGSGEQVIDLATALPQARFVGVDISPANISAAEQARRSFPRGDRLLFLEADYLTLDSGTFDLIVSCSTLQLIPASISRLFGKIGGDLKPGGLLIFTAPGACLSNLALLIVRHLARLCRGRGTDSLLLWGGKRWHPEVPEETLRQRLDYMYLIPEFSVDRRFCRRMQAFDLQLLFMHHEQETPAGKLKHQVAVFRKTNRGM